MNFKKIDYRDSTFVITIFSVLYSIVWGSTKILIYLESKNLLFIISGIVTLSLLIIQFIFLSSFFINYSKTKANYINFSVSILIMIFSFVYIILLGVYIKIENKQEMSNLTILTVLLISLVEIILSVIGVYKGYRHDDILIKSLKTASFTSTLNSSFLVIVSCSEFIKKTLNAHYEVTVFNTCIGIIFMILSFGSATILFSISVSHIKFRKYETVRDFDDPFTKYINYNRPKSKTNNKLKHHKKVKKQKEKQISSYSEHHKNSSNCSTKKYSIAMEKKKVRQNTKSKKTTTSSSASKSTTNNREKRY